MARNMVSPAKAGLRRGSEGTVRIALPSKGELEGPTLAFMEECGLRVAKHNPRQYQAKISGYPDIVVIFQRVQDIIGKVNEGSADLGISGYDLVAEGEEECENVIILHHELGYSPCELVVAIPDSWIDVSSISDMAELSADFRKKGRDLRVATKYPNLTRRFFYKEGLSHFALVSAHGALEAAPHMGYADFIVDIASSGTTLRENRLKAIKGGTLLQSQACLIGNLRVLQTNNQALEVTKLILEYFEASLRARTFYSVDANIKGLSAEAVAALVIAQPDIAGMQGPTVAPVFSHKEDSERWFEITVVIRRDMLPKLLEYYRAIGASGINVGTLKYSFEQCSWRYTTLLERLDHSKHLRTRGEPGEDE